MAARKSSGWAPYWAPFLSFMLMIEIGNRAPETAAPYFLVLKALVPGALVAWYFARGLYPELRQLRANGTLLLDVGVGLLGAVLWVAPFVFFEGLRPEAEGFDRFLLGEAGVPIVLGLRAFGYSVVTPFLEELFVRSWLMRFIDVFEQRRDFRKVPIARFTWRSFLVVVGFFVFTHQPWEWGVMLVWTLLTMAWFYHRRDLLALVLVHAVTNGAIFLFVVAGDGSFWFLI